MHHRRSPTQCYSLPIAIHASLALRHSSPTPLLPRLDAPDDLQSNACLSPRTPLAGLGISCLHDRHPHAPWRIHVDADQPLFGPEASLDDPFEPDEYRTGTRFAFIPDPRPPNLQLCLDNDIDAASDTIGLVPDVNMYDNLRGRDTPHTGINPLDTICSQQEESKNDRVLSAAHPRPEQSPSPRVIQDIMSILVRPASSSSFLPWSSAKSPSAQCLSPPTLPRTSPCIKLDPARVSDSGPHLLPAQYNFEYPNTTHPSPVLNAHLGIELGELVSRAEKFRVKYPERDIDRAWLSHFAGKLSDRGELLSDFRCYVIGCDQRNKRRDHILVHVGAHIGQRPFACSVCPLRFLRKNECKRHEASHSGFRPYSCDICGQSFVRQDLVKRHVKRTHGLKDENQPGAAGQPRKRARLG